MNIHSGVALTQDTGKHDAILDAAVELFAERGFHGTAVPLVAERAHVGAGTVYRYFESKEALVNALFRREKQQFLAALMGDFPVNAAPREQFRELWRRMRRFAEERPASAMFLELHHHAPYLDEQSRQLENSGMELFYSFIRGAQERQALKPIAPEILAAVVHGAFTGVAKAAMTGQLAAVTEPMDLAEACLWEAVRL
ncbi:MAG: TetR/AcrR family transcriptional regulator [Myxococcales bacterium]|nr:TetR/AcrR family transcriptional regulator [Myxococcales bacterium]